MHHVHVWQLLIQFLSAFVMGLTVKSVDAVVAKWKTNAGNAGNYYAQGVANTQKDWAGDTSAAAATWLAAVQQAGVNAFTAGVSKAGTAKWKAKVAAKGASAYTAGISAAAPYYQAGIQAVLNVLAALQLPPRGPKGTNYNRVQLVDERLRQLKATGS